MNTATSPTPAAAAVQDHPRIVKAMLNVAHAVDHLFLLIFAAAVATIAADFGFAKWEDLMPFGAGAFFLFGIGSLPSGRLGDLWGRRSMMLIFFFGIGAAALLTAATQNVWQLAASLTLIGAFASIYHPVGIPMLIERAANPGATIGFNGLAGNLGVAAAALLTGFLIKWYGWRMAFIVPGVLSILCGFIFAATCAKETESPSKRKGGAKVTLSPAMLARAMVVMTAAAITSSVLFNFTTNGNGLLMTERFRGVMEDPATLGALMALVYAVASIAQVVVGNLVNRFALKPFFMVMVLAQIPMLLFASQAQGWWIFVALMGLMIFVFGAIPFTDVMIARYVDDRLRSRVSGMRLGVSFAVSSLSVWALGPTVKALGFGNSMLVLACFSVTTMLILTLLPGAAHEQAAKA
jgi:predicted MFS family arabinose efflux permease